MDGTLLDPGAARTGWKPEPVDVGRLLQLGMGLSTPETPAVAALCLRLGNHVADLHPETDVSALEAWAERCYERWLDRLAHRDPDTLAATIATDPANLVLGAKALRDPLFGFRCIRSQFEAYEFAGVALPRLNQTILSAILGPSDPLSESPLLGIPLTPRELIRELSPVTAVALALMMREFRVGEPADITEDEVGAVTLRSVGARDLPGLGLSLVAANLLFGRPVPAGVLPWIARIARSDGFFGMWEMYSDCHPLANLLGTVNIYWGLSVQASKNHARDVHS